jgi:hypothetical protein
MCGKQISKKNEDMCPKCKKKYLKENYVKNKFKENRLNILLSLGLSMILIGIYTIVSINRFCGYLVFFVGDFLVLLAILNEALLFFKRIYYPKKVYLYEEGEPK